MKKYFYCLDVGGTEIKGGIVDENYNIVCSDKICSSHIKSNDDLKQSILKMIDILQGSSNLEISKSSGLGIALPGLVDGNLGIIKHLSNLNVNNHNIVEILQKELGVVVKIANDAELALIAEHKLGKGKGYNNFALITLGTGVGLGLVVNGVNLRSILPYAAEYGHNLIGSENVQLEHIFSTKALTDQIKQAMRDNPKSKMWSKYNLETANGRTVFDFKDEDDTAKLVFDNFISNLGRAIVNLVNVFTPEVILIGGGISKQGKNLTQPLENFVNDKTLISNIGLKTKIIPAKFLNEAGMIGARCLFK